MNDCYSKVRGITLEFHKKQFLVHNCFIILMNNLLNIKTNVDTELISLNDDMSI